MGVKSLKQSLHSPSPHRTSHASRTFPINPIMGDDKKDLESECNDSPSGMNPIIVYSIIAVVCLVGGFVLGMMLCGGGGTEVLVMQDGNGKFFYGSKIDKTNNLPEGEVKVGDVDVRDGIAKDLAVFISQMRDVVDKPTASKTVTFTVKYQGQKGAKKPAKGKKGEKDASASGDEEAKPK